MALIKCHECSGQISDHAGNCPHCGAPVVATIKRRQKAALRELYIRFAFAAVIIIIVWIVLHRLKNQVLTPGKTMQRKQQLHWTSPTFVVSGKSRRLFGDVSFAYSGAYMARSLYKWVFRDVTDFLQHRGFCFFEYVAGVGQVWMNFHENGEPNRMVEVKFVRTFYKPKALKKMIRQSGIPEEEWFKWGNS